MTGLSKNKVIKERKESSKLPYVVLIVSLLVTVGATFFFYLNSKNKDNIRFTTEVNKTKVIIENKLSAYVMMLRSVRAYMDSNSSADEKSFTVFVKNLEVENGYRGIEGVGFVKAVSPAERHSFVQRMKMDNSQAFTIFPERSDNKIENLYVVAYFEPALENTQKTIGFDMASEAVRLEAMNAARDSGQVSISGKDAFMDRNNLEPHSGFLIYLPTYKNGEIPQSIEDRKQLLSGFVYSPFNAEEFLQDVQNTVASNYLGISIFDGEKSQENLLAETASQNEGLYSTTTEINVANKKWIVEYRSLPDFEAQSSINFTPLVLIAGLTFSVLLFGITYVETFARIHSERIADDLKKSENEKAILLASEQKARENAENANHAKDEFIANVSHELRTPLNSIAGWSRILQSANISPDTKKQALQTIDRNLRIQTKIIEDLLDFSQITADKQLVSIQAVKISDVFEEAFAEVVPLAEEKKILFEKLNSLNGQQVNGDYPHLKKVVKNLLTNAVKFTPKGGKVTAEARESQQLIELQISDNGQGINSSFLPHIFDQFKQADSSTTRQHGGLGIGLAISRQIIECCGGEIEAESEGEGKGTIFTVKLPFISDQKERDS